MTDARADTLTPRIQEALEELKHIITDRFPEASFQVFAGHDPEGTYLEATVDVDDLDPVLDAVMDRLIDLQDEEGLPIYVLAALPPERIAEQLAQRETAKEIAHLPHFLP